MSKRAPTRPSRGKTVFNGFLLWMLAPLAFFSLGLYAIGPRLPGMKPATPAPQAEPPQADPERADNWLDDSQLPKQMGPSGSAGRRRGVGGERDTPVEPSAPIETPAEDGVTVQPADDGGAPATPPKDEPPDPDVQKPDEIR